MKTRILTTILLLTNLFLNQQSQAQCHIDDWTALKALYESTAGDNWENNEGWEIVKGSTPSVDCNLALLGSVELDDEGRVYYLYLAYNQLYGKIPSELSNLSKLSSLNLNSNDLFGSIPAEIGSLSNLTSLGLRRNNLSGNIPVELGNLSNLTSLDLYGNDLSGNIPTELGYLNNLTSLFLKYNDLNGNIPTALGNLSNLERLDLYNNRLSGMIPPEIGNLSNLTQLDLSNNQLSGMIPPELGNLSNLYDLNVSNNNLTGSFDNNLKKLCDQLENINSGGNSEISDGNNFDTTWAIFCDPSISESKCHIDDWTALKALYESTNGDNWEDKTGWDTMIDNLDSPPENCNLSELLGIELDHFNRVYIINLGCLGNTGCNGNNLEGTIPKEINKLSNLSNLYLINNKLSGSIPTEIGNLENLTYIDLSENELTGGIPATIANLSKLKRFKCSRNQLSGNFDVNLLPLCENPYISNDEIVSGNKFNTTWAGFCDPTIEVEVCNIDEWLALKAFYESTNGNDWTFNDNWEYVVSNSSPPEDCSLSSLFGIVTNESGRVVGTNFRYYKESNNNIVGSLPPEIGNLTELEYLDLHDNYISGSIPSEISNLTNLEVLNLRWNEIEYIPSSIGNLNLTELYLSNNQISGTIPSVFGGMLNLTELNLFGNNFSGNIPEELCNLSNLASLNLGGNKLNGTIPIGIGDLNNLTDLNLQNNELFGEIPPELGNLNELESLNLGANQLSGCIPSEISNLTNLETLDLANNQLSENSTNVLISLGNLTHLYLDNNYFIGEIPPHLGNLTNLEVLSINNNQLSGSIPAELCKLTKLEYLNLSYNLLSGGIPDFSKWYRLEELHLNNNLFSGSIPSSLNILTLKKLLLNNNKLTGIVPDYSMHQNGWSLHFDISNNYLSCSDITENFDKNNEISEFIYSPQHFDNELFVHPIDTSEVFQPITLQPSNFPNVNGNYTYQWSQNGNLISGSINPSHHILENNPIKAGKYVLHISETSCPISFQYQSEPIYVIFKGFDLLGQPVEYTQLMVEFESKAAKQKHEQEIFLDNGGIWADKCDCNRELHLYDFPKDSSSIEQAYIALDQKIKRLKVNNEIDGGFNYKLNNIGLNFSPDENTNNPGQHSYNVSFNYPSATYMDSSVVYLLDSGLDENNFDMATNYLMENAPIDSCYSISARGYNFTKVVQNLKDYSETIDTDYKDKVGHGTFGFRSITEGLQGANNTKIVPLKIIENATDGNLFDLICAMYHAVDHNANVINISAGYRGEPSGIMENILYEAREKDIFVVAAAGNDALNIDDPNQVPQYPAYYSSQYHSFYKENEWGRLKFDSVPFNNLISVTAVNVYHELSDLSNFGANSVTIAAPGENLYGFGLEGEEIVGTGTSFAAFLTSQVLAKEIAHDNSRSIDTLWADFSERYLKYNPKIANSTSTGKQIDFIWSPASLSDCMDELACNYNPFANIDDGSCYTCAEPGCNECPEDCPPCQIAGCTDAVACNYNENVSIDDGSCVYEFNCNKSNLVTCPEDKETFICAPVNPPPPLSLEDFTATGNVTLLSALSLQVIQKTDAYKYYNTTTYDYIITDGAGNQNTCQNKYHIANEFLQTPEITDPPFVCQDDLWSYIKLGTDEYKIYEDENGNKGQELTTCNTPGLHCSTSALAVNTAEPGNRQFWVTQFFTFPDGSVCESEATPFEVNIQAKPFATMSMQNIAVNRGEGINLMDVMTNNKSGYWTGENIVYLMTADGENIPYFSANAAGVYKLYYTVSNDYCERSYLLIVDVGGTGLVQKEEGEFTESDYRIDEAITNQDFTIYPNPSSGKLFIELSDHYENNALSLFDLTGKTLLQSRFKGKHAMIDLSDFAKGMYIIEIQNTNIKSIQKLLIE